MKKIEPILVLKGIERMNNKKIIPVGTEQYMLVTSQSEGQWHALLAPIPSQGTQWTCEAVSEDELEKKLARHYEKVLQTQKIKE